ELPDNITDNSTEYYKYLYKNSYKQAKEYYDKYLPLYKKISSQSITLHTRLTDSLTKTVYSNGTVVYVNYSDVDVEADGLTIKPKSFAFIN
ncbi:MAG: hypothetical protein IKB45_04240, partial [Clostridia bacterium]|nr:hypothetical protein [Clostridia bacterium]